MYLGYLILDIIYFFNNRINELEVEGFYTSGHHENIIRSVLKWLIASFNLFYLLSSRHFKISNHLFSVLPVVVLCLYFIGGQFNNLILGSIVSNILLLEGLSILSLIYLVKYNNTTKKQWMMQIVLGIGIGVVVGLILPPY